MRYLEVKKMFKKTRLKGINRKEFETWFPLQVKEMAQWFMKNVSRE